MLSITIELIPGGYAPSRRTIATMQLANITDLAAVSDYDVRALEAANALAGTPPRIAGCQVKGHDRRQSVWALVAEAARLIQEAEFAEF